MNLNHGYTRTHFYKSEHAMIDHERVLSGGDSFPIDYHTAWLIFLILLIALVVLWVSPFVWMCCAENVPLFCRSDDAQCKCIILWLALIPLIIGCIFMTMYAKDAGSVEQYEYLGPMRVKSQETFYRHVEKGCSGGESCCNHNECEEWCCQYHEYSVRVELEWGYDWSCPQHGLPCHSLATYEPCTRRACKNSKTDNCAEESLAIAESSARACAEELLNSNTSYPEYDPSDPPCDDWPTVEFYGDCDECIALHPSSATSNDKIRRLKLTGGMLILIGLVPFVWLLVLHPIVTCIWRDKRNVQTSAAFAAY